MTHLHMEHVRAHLARVRDGQIAVPDVESTFLGAVDEESFQELIGFRMAGMATAMLAVLSFQKLGFPGIVHARESLASYLTSPPRALPEPFAAGEGIPVLLPGADEAIPSFLRGLRAGRRMPSIVLEPSRIRLAFDFRGHNPSAVEAVRRVAAPLRSYVLRTVEGHVLSGRSREIPTQGRHRFVALADVVQHTPRGAARLVDVMINASWIAVWADVTDETGRAPTRLWPPFLASDAASDVVLGLTDDPGTAPAPPRVSPLTESRFPS